MANIITDIQLSGITYQIQGEVTVDAALDSGSTNPVANSAITTALDDKVNVVDNEVPDYVVESEITYQGGYPSQSETASTWDDASMFTLKYNYIRISEANYTTTAAVIDPSGNITTGRTTIEDSVGNPLPDYIDMSFSLDDYAYRFTAKEGYRIAHLDIYNDKWATWGYIREERVDTVFEGGQSADVIKDVIEPTLINKQDKLVAGENITISGNVISSTGGDGKTLVAGRGIEITTADTTNTISFNLPISGTGLQSIAEGGALSSDGYRSHAEGHNTVADGAVAHAEGNATQALGTNSHSEGNHTKASSIYSHAEGFFTQTNNQSEHASGQYNVSSSASTTFGDSGNTLFSVGNGTSNSARHNAFEIRQNGDIYLTKDGQDVKLQDHLGGGSVTVDSALSPTSENPVQNKAIYNKFDEVEQVTAAALNELNDAISGKVDASTYNTYTAATDTALNGKQPTLVSGTNIKTINNESILGSGNIDIQGGSTYTAGRGISITTGETADTVSFDLPISATTNGSILIGVSCSANRDKSFVGGQRSVGQGEGSFAFGQNCKAAQWSIAVGDHIEANIMPSTAAFGKYNKQNGGYFEPQSATTLFSVGNGASTSARHNAFEIRQNGDIYLTLDGQDVKLQDQLGGGSVTVDSALSPTSENPVQNKVIYNKIDEVEEVTAAGLNALNDKFDGLRLKKLTQTEYNNLQTKDPSTLYVIVD